MGARDYGVMRASIDNWLPFLSPEASIVIHDASGGDGGAARIIAELEVGGSFKRSAHVANTIALRRAGARGRHKSTPIERRSAVDLFREYARAHDRDPKFVLSRLEHSTFVSSRHRYVYIETPKAACTTMKYFVAELEKAYCDLQRKPYLRETRRSMLIHQRKYVGLPTLLDLKSEELQSLLSGGSGYFIFGLVRNPFSRLVSAFESKVRLLEPGFRQMGLRWTAAEANDDVRETFSNFVEKELEAFGQIEHHFTAQYQLLFPEFIPYTKFFQLEHFAEFERAFSAHLQSVGAKAIPQFKDRNRTVYPDWRLYYDRPTAERVAKIFAKDFATFGYDPHSWRIDREAPELRTSAAEAYWRKEVMERNELIEFLYELLRTGQ